MNQDNVITVLTALLNDKSDLDQRLAAVDGLGYTGFTSGRKALRLAAIRALGRSVYSSK